MPTRLLITTPTGNVGFETLRSLAGQPNRAAHYVVAASRDPDADRRRLGPLADDYVRFDFADPTTFDGALTGVEKVLLVRPPQLADVPTYFAPLIDALVRHHKPQVVFLSLQGVENNPLTPHHKIEKRIVAAGLPYTFLRPSFFMQNLSTTHRREIAERDEIFVPAGHGRTSFIDVRDIADVAALALTTNEHVNQAYELTGSEALTYTEVAAILTDVLGRKITYRNPSVARFIWRHWVTEKTPLGFVLIMTALYSVAKLGKAAGLTNELPRLLHRPPTQFRQFAEANRAAWQLPLGQPPLGQPPLGQRPAT